MGNFFSSRSISENPQKAKEMLSQHSFVELRTESFVLSREKNAPYEQQEPVQNDGSRRQGTWEIALLVMACAIFLGGLIALVAVCSLRYKR